MEHTQTTLAEILGRTKPCIFKARFKYDPCRSCDGLNQVCENYLSQPVRKPRVESIPRDYYTWIRQSNDAGVIIR